MSPRCILRGMRIPEIAMLVRERFFSKLWMAQYLRFFAENTILGHAVKLNFCIIFVNMGRLSMSESCCQPSSALWWC